MMKRMKFTRVIVLSFALILGAKTSALSHGMVGGELAPLEPGRVIAVMESDFLVPRGFSGLPGPMFYLTHATALSLSSAQKKKILEIARSIMPRTIRAGTAIERLKAQVVHLSSPGRGSGSGPGSGAEINLPRIRELLLEIGRREALADFEHVAAHRECLELLTPSQRLHLKRLLARDSSP